MASNSFSQQEHCPPPPNWLELPNDVSSSIIRRLDVVEILTSVQYVCSKWRRICKDPSMWKTFDFVIIHEYPNFDDLTKLYQLAVDLSSGGLVDVSLDYFSTDALLVYIVDRSKHLRRLKMSVGFAPPLCKPEINFIDVAQKLPLLEELEISASRFTEEAVAAFGRQCTFLHSFSYNVGSNGEAFAIAENMPGLRHLRIYGNELRDVGLIAILDSCKKLESLDLSGCRYLKLDDDLKRRCSDQIKDFRAPNTALTDFYRELSDGLLESVSSSNDYELLISIMSDDQALAFAESNVGLTSPSNISQ